MKRVNKLTFEIWNKRHNRFATEDEFKEYVELGFNGIGFVDSAYVSTKGDLEIRTYDNQNKKDKINF